MRITRWEIKEESDAVEVSADIDGFRLWYRVPGSYDVSRTRTGDVFLASALLPAMRQGGSLEIDPSMPVSPKLLKNTELLQEIFYSWNPKQLRIVPIVARPSTPSADDPITTGVASFFSGGVDSTYTLLKHADEISHAVFIQGLDFYQSRGTDSALSVSDLADLSRFSYYVMNPSNGLYAYVKSQLSPATQQALATYLTTSSIPEVLDTLLVDDLNRMIAGELIYDAKRCQGIKIQRETERLLAQSRSGEITKDLNRRLLEDACSEVSRRDSTIYSTAIERHRNFLRDFGKTLVPVETNHFVFGYRYNLSRNLSHGSCLGGVAMLLGFRRVYVPATYSYAQLFPLGSHPLTDRLWSNERTEIVHDGCEAGRTGKIKRIYKNATALANLRVCSDDMNENCGKCWKCRRTMISLALFRAPNVPFPPLPPLRSIEKERISSDIEMAFVRDNVDLAMQLMADEGLRNALLACLRRYEFRRFLVELRRSLVEGLKVATGGVVQKVYRKLRRSRPRPGFSRIVTAPTRE